MYLTNRPLPRRTVLKGMGATLALPFLEAMVPARGLRAAALNRKIRLVTIEMVHGSAGSAAIGIKKNLWAPAGVGRDSVTHPSSVDVGDRHVDGPAFSSPGLSTCWQPMERLR